MDKKELFVLLDNANESDILEWVAMRISTREIVLLAIRDDIEIVMEEVELYGKW